MPQTNLKPGVFAHPGEETASSPDGLYSIHGQASGRYTDPGVLRKRIVSTFCHDTGVAAINRYGPVLPQLAKAMFGTDVTDRYPGIAQWQFYDALSVRFLRVDLLSNSLGLMGKLSETVLVCIPFISRHPRSSALSFREQTQVIHVNLEKV